MKTLMLKLDDQTHLHLKQFQLDIQAKTNKHITLNNLIITLMNDHQQFKASRPKIDIEVEMKKAREHPEQGGNKYAYPVAFYPHEVE